MQEEPESCISEVADAGRVLVDWSLLDGSQKIQKADPQRFPGGIHCLLICPQQRLKLRSTQMLEIKPTQASLGVLDRVTLMPRPWLAGSRSANI